MIAMQLIIMHACMLKIEIKYYVFILFMTTHFTTKVAVICSRRHVFLTTWRCVPGNVSTKRLKSRPGRCDPEHARVPGGCIAAPGPGPGS